MRCIFCKNPSGSSKSVEHIIPESLGNKSHVLPKGIVCDGCNNYFARKIEKPFLDLPSVKILRFRQEIENKKGRIPSVNGMVYPDIPAVLTRNLKYSRTFLHLPNEDALRRVILAKENLISFPEAESLPSGLIVSRFLAKIALEAMAMRLIKHRIDYPEGIEYLCDETQLDELRGHARRGSVKSWPIYVRGVYSANAAAYDNHGAAEQIVHEFDFLFTDQQECYFVLIIFGVEFTINVGGPSISGYLRWLSKNNNICPLYTEKYGGASALPR